MEFINNYYLLIFFMFVRHVQVCGTDGVTYENVCVLRSQSGNARMDYYGECDVDEEDPQETPEGVCQRVSRVRRCVYNISNCRHLVRPEEGCCALCGELFVGWCQAQSM